SGSTDGGDALGSDTSGSTDGGDVLGSGTSGASEGDTGVGSGGSSLADTEEEAAIISAALDAGLTEDDIAGLDTGDFDFWAFLMGIVKDVAEFMGGSSDALYEEYDDGDSGGKSGKGGSLGVLGL
ncbi:MAG: hypothetical protein P1U86_21235, partial [Verrucomicrobiales bacterium]|nr:hypothetical protein [Verrucomicrobiales bacterium]